MMPSAAAVTIRDAIPADAATIADYNIALALESEGRQLAADTIRRGVERALADARLARYFLAESEGRVVGQTMLTYEWSDWRNGTFWWIQSVYVHAEHRGRGVFRSLFRHIESLARAQPDVCGLRLYVEHHNAPALETYLRLGMVPSGHSLYELDWSGTIDAT